MRSALLVTLLLACVHIATASMQELRSYAYDVHRSLSTQAAQARLDKDQPKRFLRAITLQQSPSERASKHIVDRVNSFERTKGVQLRTLHAEHIRNNVQDNEADETARKVDQADDLTRFANKKNHYTQRRKDSSLYGKYLSHDIAAENHQHGRA